MSEIPAPYQPTGTEARVCADIAARQQLGIAKYGTTVAGNPLPLREWLRHAYEETLDKAIYLRRALEEMEAAVGPGPEYACCLCGYTDGLECLDWAPEPDSKLYCQTCLESTGGR